MLHSTGRMICVSATTDLMIIARADIYPLASAATIAGGEGAGGCSSTCVTWGMRHQHMALVSHLPIRRPESEYLFLHWLW